MKFRDMPYERVDYDRAKEEILRLTQKVKDAENPEELWAVHQEYYRVYKGVADAMTIAHIRHDAEIDPLAESRPILDGSVHQIKIKMIFFRFEIIPRTFDGNNVNFRKIASTSDLDLSVVDGFFDADPAHSRVGKMPRYLLRIHMHKLRIGKVFLRCTASDRGNGASYHHNR